MRAESTCNHGLSWYMLWTAWY